MNPTSTTVNFGIQHKISEGQNILVTGSVPELGNWNIEKSLLLKKYEVKIISCSYIKKLRKMFIKSRLRFQQTLTKLSINTEYRTRLKMRLY